MAELGFRSLMSDGCLFFRDDLWVLLYDDIIIIARREETIEELKKRLMTRLDIKDLGQLSHFLGVSFTRESGAWISQSRYVDSVLAKFGMQNCKPVSTNL